MLLLHTWSLAVEEQYYIFFPILLWILWSYKKHLKMCLGILTISSFLYSIWLLKYDISANFYLLPSRAWELFAGAFVALNYKSLNTVLFPIRQVLSALGLILLIGCLTLMTKDMEHPGWPTLIPIFASCLVIAFSANTFIAKFLSFKLFVWIGLISYSLYLWHQPLYAIVRVKSLEEPTFTIYFIATLIALIAAWISHRYIEKPFRNSNFLTQKQIFTWSIFGLTFFALLGLSGHFQNGFAGRFNTALDITSAEYSPLRYKCHASSTNKLNPSTACILPNTPSTQLDRAVLGDSHGVELSYALSKEIELNKSVLELTYSNCPPAYIFNTNVDGCKEWINSSVKYLVEREDIGRVILIFRHTKYINATSHLLKNIFDFSNSNHLSNAEIHNLYWQSFEKIVQDLKHAGKKVIVVYPIPELPVHIKKMVTPLTIFHSKPSENLPQTSIEEYDEKSTYVIDNLNKIQVNTGFISVKPKDIFCDQKACYATSKQEILYYDENHLSLSGATLLSKAIVNL